jgi:long-chain fatty acid transport protein
MGKHHPIKGHIRRGGLVCLLSILSAGAHAAGFALIEQSVSSMGTAYANGSAGMDDASTIFFNPASMTRLAGQQVSGGFHIVKSDVDVDAKGSYNSKNLAIAGSGLGGVPIQGKKHTNTDLLAAVPHGGYSYQFSDQLWLGLTVNAPFGLKTKYDDDDWVGRYHAVKSELVTYNINPSIAFKFSEHASIGMGLSAMYADGELTNAVDGGLAAALGGAPIPGWVPGSSTYDSDAKLTGDDWGYGFNFGVLVEPNENTRIGISYRSQVNLDIEGDVRIRGPVINRTENAELDLTLPDSVSFSAYRQFSPKLALMADVTWTNWSEFDEIRVNRESGKTVTPTEWDDSVRFAVGAAYRHNDSWLYRAGLAYDQTPVPEDQLRTPRVPDEDRIWLTLGANYRYSKQLSFDIGYAHLFVKDPEIKNGPDANDPTLPFPAGLTGFHSLNAEYDATVNMLSMQLNWQFD